jgi:hypothetical protein
MTPRLPSPDFYIEQMTGYSPDSMRSSSYGNYSIIRDQGGADILCRHGTFYMEISQHEDIASVSLRFCLSLHLSP